MKTQTENPQAAMPQAADSLTENQPAENLKAVHLPEANLKADHWLTAIDSDNRLQQTLSCFLPRGIATREQVEVLTGMSQHPVRDMLKMLTEPPGGLSPLLKPLNVSLPGRRGRSQAAYLLTPDGASAFEDQTRHSPVLTQSVEAAHALMEMQVYIAAFQANLLAAVEKVLFYEGTHNIRVDVLVGSTALFEIEQSAQRKDVPRIATKLEHLQYFFLTQAAKGIDTRVRVLFGLSATDGKTITTWRQVLGAVEQMKGEIQFEIYWQYISDFLANPDWNDIAGFTKLEPLIPNQPPSQKDCKTPLETKSTVLPEFVSRGQIDLEEINLVMYALDSTIDSNEGIETNQRQQFFEIIETIYDGSHYRGGPVMEKLLFR